MVYHIPATKGISLFSWLLGLSSVDLVCVILRDQLANIYRYCIKLIHTLYMITYNFILSTAFIATREIHTKYQLER